MRHLVLGIGYPHSILDAAQREWVEYGVCFDSAYTPQHAACKLQTTNYTCIIICSEESEHIACIDTLRRIKQVPIIVLPPDQVMATRRKHLEMGAKLYFENEVIPDKNTGSDMVRQYLDLPVKSDVPLTIITGNQFFFCLEYRLVFVNDEEISLTPKEFDILHLLVTHPKRVYTYEMLSEIVWGETYNYYQKKTINNHCSKLRQKLKPAPEAPEYIVNVYGVGYKYDPA